MQLSDRLLAVFAVVVIGLSAPAFAQTQYVVTDLGTLGGTKNIPITINNLGQVVGYSSVSGDSPAFAYRTEANQPINPAIDNLGVLAGGTSSAATGINNRGQVAGFTTYTAPISFAFRADPGKPLLDLGALVSSAPTSSTSRINNFAQVAGQSNVNNPCVALTTTSHAFITAPGGDVTAATDLGTLVPAPNTACGFSIANDVNDAGYVVGWSSVNTTIPLLYHASLSIPGTPAMQDLGSLGGPSFASFANGINQAGQIVGQSAVSALIDSHAFLTTAIGPMQDLGTLGGNYSTAQGINNAGQIVGVSTLSDGSEHAFLYTGGVMEDINSLIPASSPWVIQSANAINDRGQIVGNGFFSGGPLLRGVRLDPVDIAVTILIEDILNSDLGLTIIQKITASVPLVDALIAVQLGNYAVAINQLNAFITEVGVLQSGGYLSPANAAGLIAEANAIIAAL